MQPRGVGAGAAALSLALLLAMLALTACKSDSPVADTGLDYAAIGDSYTAAPWLTKSSTDGCARSDHNYPHLVAKRVSGMHLIDVSCGGATTRDVIQSQELGDRVYPPQLEAISENTDLATVGIGGNDFHVSYAIIYLCVQLAASDPEGAPCRDANVERLPRLLTRIQDRLVEVLDTVSARAPEARILMIGYPQLLADESAGCPGRLRLARGDIDFVRESFNDLNATLAAAAREANVEYVDVAAASEGHDICSDDPWVNGDVDDPETGAAAYHPMPAGQAAVAELILDLL